MKNYSNIQKILHDIVLGKKFINHSLYEIEKIFFIKKKNFKNETHVFITGLPRSGTTSILNFLFLSGEYASLTYRNMPFVMAPNFSKFFNKKNILTKERLHSDGIDFNLDSPETLDEIFFNNNESFIRDELTNYIELILSSKDKDKYLSKNNLNFKRKNLIHSIFPNSIFLIPIREPLQQSYSLLNQHINFSRLQREDDFIRRYMKYIGHNEFGLNHRPWYDPIKFSDFNNINYWLEQWYLSYKYIYNEFLNFENSHFILYEKLTNLDYVEKILKKIKLKKNKINNLNYFKNSNKKIDIEYDENIYNNANIIYKNFLNLT